jgi:hypothetical protein
MLARYRDQPKLVSGSAAAVCELRCASCGVEATGQKSRTAYKYFPRGWTVRGSLEFVLHSDTKAGSEIYDERDERGGPARGNRHRCFGSEIHRKAKSEKAEPLDCPGLRMGQVAGCAKDGWCVPDSIE